MQKIAIALACLACVCLGEQLQNKVDPVLALAELLASRGPSASFKVPGAGPAARAPKSATTSSKLATPNTKFTAPWKSISKEQVSNAAMAASIAMAPYAGALAKKELTPLELLAAPFKYVIDNNFSLFMLIFFTPISYLVVTFGSLAAVSFLEKVGILEPLSEDELY